MGSQRIRAVMGGARLDPPMGHKWCDLLYTHAPVAYPAAYFNPALLYEIQRDYEWEMKAGKR